MDSDMIKFGVGMSDKVAGIRDYETISCAAHLHGTDQSGEPLKGNIGCYDPSDLGRSACLLRVRKKDASTVVIMMWPPPSSKYGSVQTGRLEHFWKVIPVFSEIVVQTLIQAVRM